ncbi:hypothetical protein SITYG_19790 [Streptococcus intermedius]|uniref:Uncharacterized protein n=1 Tax=Streptococcus intermedius TaxID=1338 RepID=A0AAD1FK75_STRIT|nr:hypothetical protein SITYG_19790 [Streptococcus intermedius]
MHAERKKRVVQIIMKYRLMRIHFIKILLNLLGFFLLLSLKAELYMLPKIEYHLSHHHVRNIKSTVSIQLYKNRNDISYKSICQKNIFSPLFSLLF